MIPLIPRRLLGLGLAVLCGLALGSPTASASQKQCPVSYNGPDSPVNEYIILSGGPSLMEWEKYKTQPHDLWWMNFVRASRIRIQQLEAQGVSGKQITWLVFARSYRTRGKQDSQDLIANIASVRDLYGVNLKFFERSSEVIQYINQGKPRDTIKIADLEYFGHSNKACWMFDYSNNIDSASKVWIHEDDLQQLQRGIFAKHAFVMSWGCHTAEEMSQKFRKYTGVKMWGAIGRTQYNTDILPSLAAADGRWGY